MILSYNGLDILARIFLGLISTYLVASISELLLHRYFAHASSRTRQFWAKYPHVFGRLIRLHYRHAIVHHGMTFRVNHVTQFKDEDARNKVNRIIAPKQDDFIISEDYGLTIGLRSMITYNITVVPIIPILYLVAGPWVLIGALPGLAISPLTAMLVHPVLHQHPEESAHKAPAIAEFLLNTWYFRMLWRYHYVHHIHQNSNFNLILGGDFLLGTYRKPNAIELSKMATLRLPLDLHSTPEVIDEPLKLGDHTPSQPLAHIS